MGFTATGIFYLLIGVLAALAAYSPGGTTTGSLGALRQSVQLPFGRVQLVLVATGLVSYALWLARTSTAAVSALKAWRCGPPMPASA